MSHISILRQHVLADMRPSSGLITAKQVKSTVKYILNGIHWVYNGCLLKLYIKID